MWIEIVEPQQKLNLLKSMGLYNYNLLDATFQWRETSEGENFWNEKDRIFREKYRKMTGKE